MISNEILERVIDLITVGQDIDEAVENIEYLCDRVEFADEKIDDGCDESEEDNYVMMQSYNVSKDNYHYYLRLYYGDVTREVGSVEITEQ